ncbi:hypothetical protein R5R35_013970 [Gryllus longicercus]
MSSHPPTVSLSRYESVIDDLPDEVLEYILSLVPPYKDLHHCSLVCKRWQRSVKNVIRHTQKNLLRAIAEFNIMWKDVTPVEMTPTITKRYSHSACRYGNSMYVFGGCTSTSTTFNDLWRLDLNKRQWERPLTMGTYPSPKACASVVCYKDALVLFGGWTHPSPYPLHQSWRLFNELHMYSIVSKRWTSIHTTTLPPAMAGHSSTIHGENMVVFGGLQKTTYMGQYGSSNDIWVFNLENHVWNKQATTDNKPHPRYGQSQIALDDNHILILGGCGGPNMVFSDVWLLTMTDRVWVWQEVTVHNTHCAPTHMWCHPACKIGQHVVVFSRNPVSNAPALPFKPSWSMRPLLPTGPREDESLMNERRAYLSECRRGDRDPNVNGRRGVLVPRNLQSSSVPSTSSSSGDESETESSGQTPPNKRISTQCSKSPEPPPPSPSSSSSTSSPASQSPSVSPKPYVNMAYNDMETNDPVTSSGIGGMAAFRDIVPVSRANCSRNRQRQLESIRKMEERLKSLSRSANGSASTSTSSSSPSNTGSASTSGSSGGSSSNNSSSDSPTKPEPCNATPRPSVSPSPSSPVHKSHIPKNAMTMFVLNISNVLTEDCSVEWLPMKNENIAPNGPEEMILYSLIAGKGELIMFGGIQKDATLITAQSQICSNVASTVCNSLYFISAPKGII